MSHLVPFTIASVVSTLAELKQLPAVEQDMLLLRRLLHIYPHMQSSGGLHKGNLLLAEDFYGLGTGLPFNENMPIRKYLLSAPWTRLVNRELLADPAGIGYFALTDEGIAAALSPEEHKNKVVKDISDIPTAFISYSWDSLEHKNWVRCLAKRLWTQGRVNVILDHWHLHIGDDRTLFMEDSIRRSNFVLLVCTPTYAQKSNARLGGVGYEATILTGQRAQRITQSKFIPVLRFGDWNDSAILI